MCGRTSRSCGRRLPTRRTGPSRPIVHSDRTWPGEFRSRRSGTDTRKHIPSWSCTRPGESSRRSSATRRSNTPRSRRGIGEESLVSLIKWARRATFRRADVRSTTRRRSRAIRLVHLIRRRSRKRDDGRDNVQDQKSVTGRRGIVVLPARFCPLPRSASFSASWPARWAIRSRCAGAPSRRCGD
jgi:hypothetical protein